LVFFLSRAREAAGVRCARIKLSNIRAAPTVRARQQKGATGASRFAKVLITGAI
jgi:hypothetical protein